MAAVLYTLLPRLSSSPTDLPFEKPPPQVVFSFSEQEITTVTTGSQEDHLLRETNYHYVCLSTYLGNITWVNDSTLLLVSRNESSDRRCVEVLLRHRGINHFRLTQLKARSCEHPLNKGNNTHHKGSAYLARQQKISFRTVKQPLFLHALSAIIEILVHSILFSHEKTTYT